MEFNFTRDDLLGDVAEWMRAEQGDRFKKTLYYDIEKKAGHPVTTTDNWYDARNLLGFYEWLTFLAAYGPDLANRSLSRVGYKLVPLASAKVDATALKADIDSAVEKLTDVSCEIGRAIEQGGGDKEKDAA